MSENSLQDGIVNLVVALKPEARPLIDHFSLERHEQLTQFPVYSNRHGVNLIVSGVGKEYAAMACGSLAAMQPNDGRSGSWFNVGIAGHGSLALEEGFVVSRIDDEASGRCYFPSTLIDIECCRSTLLSVSKPQDAYDLNQAYDMEASAFFVAANRLVPSDLIQCFKIVSDNPDSGTSHISSESVRRGVSRHLKSIAEIVIQLASLSAQYNKIYHPPASFVRLKQRWHFTVNETTQLEELLRRCEAFGVVDVENCLSDRNFDNAKAVLNELKNLLQQAEV